MALIALPRIMPTTGTSKATVGRRSQQLHAAKADEARGCALYWSGFQSGWRCIAAEPAIDIGIVAPTNASRM